VHRGLRIIAEAVGGDVVLGEPRWKWLQVDDYLDGAPSDTAIPADQLRTVVREALQNSIDEIDKLKYPDSPTRVRIGVRNLTGKKKKAFVRAAQLQELIGHLEASTIGGLKKGRIDIDLNDMDQPLQVFRYEDSRTKGLLGDQFDPRSNFFSLLKSSGETMKVGGGGSHGKGKTVWSRSSRLRSFLVHSITDSRESRVFGLCRANPHALDGTDYRGIAMFAVPTLHRGKEKEGFADGYELGEEMLASLQLSKELSESRGEVPAGTVFVVPGFIAKANRHTSDINREIIRIVGAEYWPALVMEKVVVEVEVAPGAIVVVDLSDPNQEHDPQIVALAEMCREAKAGRVHLRDVDGISDAGIPSRFHIALDIPKTRSLIEVQNHEDLGKDFAGGQYELTYVLNKDPRVENMLGLIATFRENGQIVETIPSVPEGIIGFVALGQAAQVVAPDLPAAPKDVSAFGDLMIRLLEVAAHDRWDTKGRHEQFDQYFPKDETRSEARQSFERFRSQVVRIARQFAGKFDDEVNEMVRDLTRYPGIGVAPPLPQPAKMVWSVVSFEEDTDHNVHLGFLVENKTGAKRDVEVSILAQSDPSVPLPIDRRSARVELVAQGGSKIGRPTNSPSCTFRDEKTLRVTVPGKKSVRILFAIKNDLTQIPVELALTRLDPVVRDLGV
jgi:hypothetical protein